MIINNNNDNNNNNTTVQPETEQRFNLQTCQQMKLDEVGRGQ